MWNSWTDTSITFTISDFSLGETPSPSSFRIDYISIVGLVQNRFSVQVAALQMLVPGELTTLQKARLGAGILEQIFCIYEDYSKLTNRFLLNLMALETIEVLWNCSSGYLILWPVPLWLLLILICSFWRPLKWLAYRRKETRASHIQHQYHPVVVSHSYSEAGRTRLSSYAPAGMKTNIRNKLNRSRPLPG